MKFFKKLLAGVSALVLSAGMTVSGFVGMPAAAVDDNNDDWLHAVGSRLYDKDGNEVWITGANWFGFNCGERFPHGLWSADVDAMISTIADHGINCLRLPIATELLMDWMNGVDDSEKVAGGINPKNTPDYSFNPELCRPDGSGMGSLEVFEVIMAKCKKYGVKVLVDVHSPALHNSGHNYNVWYYNSKAGDCDNMAVTEDGTQVTTEMWQDSLVWLADRYKNDDTLIAYDLKNEPHGKGQEGTAAAKWDGSTDENNWAYASTQCALAMLEKNPNALILIEGVEQYPREGHTWGEPDSKTNPPYYPGWWGGQFRGVREYPIDLGKYQSQLVYSPHDYGPGVYNQTWFQKDFTTQSLLDDYWYDTWAFINAEDIAPLLIGEWGGFMDGAENQKWMTLLRDYMIDNHINHTFWCINPNSGDTGGLLGYDWATWDDAKYELFEPSLWQTSESGKYISLDHAHKLGSSGLTTAEYYASYAASEGSNLDAGGKTDPVPTDPVTEPVTDPATEPTTEPVTDPATDPVTQPTETEPPTDPKKPDAVLWGDADGNGKVEIQDVVFMNRVYVGIDTILEDGKKNSDVDQDGKITLSDSMNVLKLLVHLVTQEDFPIAAES